MREAPTLGNDTEKILFEFGFSNQEINHLFEKQVISSSKTTKKTND